ncbi:DNA polymerase III subunit delta [Arthrobacter cheniae]|uniref:DNA polymerase III subunit delta n=1 Tax=Arthrobacter cheniae TaxID=1258888 RepID=A0A3A5M458_9MICC|nr:DNA polymerase III subunit delta [Arthrobacter cheniae]RJT81879.1 DNA polymerase III subunit delta [Arthrobacter cheniae]
MATRHTAGRTTGGGQQPASWRDVRPAAVVLLSGPEDYLASKAAEAIRHQVRTAQPDVELVRFDAGAYEAGTLTMHASPSLFGDWKVIEASGLAQMNDAFLIDALAYLSDPAPDVVLVMRHSGGNRGKKLLDAIKATHATVVDCQPLKKDAEKAEFVSTEFRLARRRIEPDAVRALVAAVGSQLPELAAACQQLTADTAGDVTVESVEKYYGGRIEATGFKVADAALAGRTAQALSMLRHALATGADPVPIVAALAMKVRAVAKVHGVRGSSMQLAKELGMAPWQVDQARKEAQRFSSDALARCIRALAEADAQVKGESRDPVYAVERAVTVIALGDS